MVENICVACGKAFKPHKSWQLYCTPQCRYSAYRRSKVEQRKEDGVCPQCGNDWIDPKTTKRGKPNHCRHCQEYYHERYEKSREG